MSKITIGIAESLSVEEYLTVMHGSGLSGRRPYGTAARVEEVLGCSSPLVEARDGAGTLVGVARSISDGGFVTFLCDLAVIESHQEQGIARDLLEATRDACEGTLLVVTAAPELDAFYDHMGLRRHHSTWYGLPQDLSGFPDPPPVV